jgi:hypothetical protein
MLAPSRNVAATTRAVAFGFRTLRLGRDLLVVDGSTKAHRVLAVIQSVSGWRTEVVADSLDGFFAALDVVSSLAMGRETARAISANPVPTAALRRALDRIRAANPTAPLDFWSSWLDPA